jgi:hypothetical protein
MLGEERRDLDVAQGERAEADLNAFIERRSRKGEVDRDEKEELWKASVRAYNDKRLQMARLEWHAFHCGQAERHRATLRALIEHHEQQAAKLMDVQPKGAA